MKRYSPVILVLVLIGAIAAVQAVPAAAASLAGPVPLAGTVPLVTPSAQTSGAEEDEEFEAEEDEVEFEDCEGGEFEFEEEEEEEAELEECGEEETGKDGAAVTAPTACRVRRAESSITTLPDSDRVLLMIRYTTYAPSSVSVGLKLKDGNGSLAIEHATKHLGRQGVLHLTTKLGDAVMNRAAKAKEFDVALRAANTPGYCGALLEQKLRSKHPVGKARVYTQPVED